MPAKSSIQRTIMVLSLTTGSIGLFSGLLLGTALGYRMKRTRIIHKETTQEVNFEFQCGKIKTKALVTAAERIRELEESKSEAEHEIELLEASLVEAKNEAADPDSDSRVEEIKNQLERAKSNLERTKSRLKKALEETEELKTSLEETSTQLTTTTQKLNTQIKETNKVREESIRAKYFNFVKSAQIKICKNGTKKRLSRCQDVVKAYMRKPTIQKRFNHCLRAGQETPRVAFIENGKGPPYSQEILTSDRDTKGWHVVFCDPSLPEAQ